MTIKKLKEYFQKHDQDSLLDEIEFQQRCLNIHTQTEWMGWGLETACRNLYNM